MSTRTKSIVAFALCMALAAFVYLWSGPLNRGKISITGEMANALVESIEGITQCSADPCMISMTTGDHKLTVQKSGFFPETLQVTVSRFKTESIQVKLKKIPNLKESQVVPAEKRREEKPLPEDLGKRGVVTFAWDPTGEKLAFLDPADEKLKLWSGEVSKTITPLKAGIGPMRLVWSPNQGLILGTTGRDVYRIDTQSASKKKAILTFDPSHFLWSAQGDFILVNDPKGKVVRMEASTLAIREMDLNVDLGTTAWSPDGKLVYATFDEKENKTTIKAYGMESGLESEITAKFDFPISKIATDENGAIYFFNDRQQNWYLLDN